MPPRLIHLRHPLSSGTTNPKIPSIRLPANTLSFATIATTAHSHLRSSLKQTSRIVPTIALHSPFFPTPFAHRPPQINNNCYSFLSRPMTTLSQRQKEASTMPTYPEYRSLVPPLNASLHKGQGGKQPLRAVCFHARFSSSVMTLLYLSILTFSLSLSLFRTKLIPSPSRSRVHPRWFKRVSSSDADCLFSSCTQRSRHLGVGTHRFFIPLCPPSLLNIFFVVSYTGAPYFSAMSSLRLVSLHKLSLSKSNTSFCASLSYDTTS